MNCADVKVQPAPVSVAVAVPVPVAVVPLNTVTALTVWLVAAEALALKFTSPL
jgi:hypothetical protein